MNVGVGVGVASTGVEVGWLGAGAAATAVPQELQTAAPFSGAPHFEQYISSPKEFSDISNSNTKKLQDLAVRIRLE